MLSMGVQYGNEELATTVLESYRRKGRTDTWNIKQTADN